MEALGILKFWRYAAAAAAAADASSDGDDVRNTVSITEDEETDDEDSFFDLVFNSPHRDGGLKKESKFIESPRDVFMSKTDCSNSKPLSPVSILRSAPKFKVFMLGFKKTAKCEKPESTAELKASPVNRISKSSKLGQSNRFSLKCRVAEMPPPPPIFARDNSLRSKMMKENLDYETSSDAGSSEKSVPKYLKLIKPFYSKKVKSGESVTPSSSPVAAPVNLSPRKFSEGSRVGSFKIVARNLGKSRSGSAAVGVAAPPPARRRDDSLLEQHDGIQGAILHCKRSYNSSSQEFSQLFRSASDTSHEKLRGPARNSYEEPKRSSI